MSCSFWKPGCPAGWRVKIVPFRAGSACCLSGKVRDLAGHIRHTGRSVSRGIFGLCGDPAWRVYGDTVGEKCESNQFWVQFWELIWLYVMYLDSPHAEARAGLPVLPPPCLSIREERQDQWAADFHQILNKRLREVGYTYWYLVLIVEKHVNSFLMTYI